MCLSVYIPHDFSQSKQVVTEIESLKQIRHPNVMKLYAYNLNARYPTKKGEKIDTVLLVLEFAPGGEIFDILYYTSALEPILARTYFRQSVIGLEACHNAGVAHRDIKPQNLLLDSRFNIRLTDFGLSKVFESDADAIMKTTYVGTRGYQAPELLLDQPYDLACDVFSMGLLPPLCTDSDHEISAVSKSLKIQNLAKMIKSEFYGTFPGLRCQRVPKITNFPPKNEWKIVKLLFSRNSNSRFFHHKMHWKMLRNTV